MGAWRMDENPKSWTTELKPRQPKPPQFWMMLGCIGLLPLCYLAFQWLQPTHPQIAIIPGLGIFAALIGITYFGRAYQRTKGPEQAAAADARGLDMKNRFVLRIVTIVVGLGVWEVAIRLRPQIPFLASMTTQHFVWLVVIAIAALVLGGEYAWRGMRRRQSGR